MKILFLSHKFYPEIGGIEIHSEILAESFTRAGHDVHLVTWSVTEDDREFPYTVVRNPGKIQLIREHSWADLVFENNPSVRLAWPQYFIHRPLVVALHTWISRTDGTESWIDRFKTRRLARAKKVISCSKALRSRCWPEAVVIENPYRENLFRVMQDVPRTYDFVFLGRLVSDKGVDIAIRAIAALKATEKLNETIKASLSLTIIGEGPEREKLQKLVKDWGLENAIILKGALRGEVLVRCLNEHRFLLVPSVWEEPFGMVALEGMACGCVPIVSDSGGLPEAIGNAGLMFQRGSVDSLVDVLLQVLEDQEMENNLRMCASNHLATHKQEQISNRYLQVFEEALN